MFAVDAFINQFIAVESADQIRFVEDLGADSLETVELIMGLEDKFGITIADEDAEQIRTVQAAVDYVASKQ